MKTSAWIQTPTLTKREAKLMRAWNIRMHEIWEEEGRRQLSMSGDGIPVLVGLIFKHFPKAGSQRRLELIGKVMRERERAELLYHHAEGSA